VAKKANSPQLWLTLLWHVGSGLPWAWRSGPSDSSERGHLQEMLQELPKNSLITADAGFVGYDFWKAILDAQQAFVIRVGANVRLLKKLGCAREYDHTVYLWPNTAAKGNQPPLVLRLIVIHNGKHPVYLVTNLPKTRLSDSQAATIYAARWGIELYFRSFQQTFGCRKLRSRAAENARLELDWSMLGLWCICLLGQRELAENGTSPAWFSVARAIRAFQKTIREYRVRPTSAAESLWQELRVCLLDGYARRGAKTSRNYPRQKKREAIGIPKLTPASQEQIDAALDLKKKQQEFQLTA
jgi:Transposase DDE domain